MREWRTRSLSCLADIRISNVDKKSIAGQKQVRLCNYMDVYANDYVHKDIAFMEATAAPEEIAKFKVSRWDVMITKDSEAPDDIGIAAVVVDEIDDLVCGYHLALIKPDLEQVDPVFLAKQISSSSVADYFRRMAAGSTRYGLSNGAIRQAQISFPALKQQQQKIARILQTVDRAIETTEALIGKYQQVKAGLMHDLFTRGIGKDGKLRPSRSEAPDLYKETSIGWLPKEWATAALNSIASYQHGRPFPSSQYCDEGALLLRPGNLHASGFVLFDETHTTCLPISWAKACPEFLLRQGDVIMNLTAQSLDDEFLGRVCLYEGSDVALLNQRIARFSARKVEPIFLYWILKSRQFRLQIEATSQGTKVQHLYNADLDRVVFHFPPETRERTQISEALLSCTLKIQSMQKELQMLRQQKAGLMHDLLTGKVEVKIDEPEAAHV